MSVQADDSVRERVLREIISLAPRACEHVDERTDLEDDLGFESLTLVELALALEQAFDLPPLSEGDALEIATVGDVQQVVARMLAAGGQSAG